MTNASPKPLWLTQEFLKSILDYDPNTGVMIWRYRSDYPPAWNAKYANKQAGCPGTKSVGLNIYKYNYRIHRIIWLWMTGIWPEYDIDHINRNPLDNRWENLREATFSQNQMNRGRQSNNTSGYTGVVYSKVTKRWLARIKINGKSKHLGCFKTAELANKCRLNAEKVYFGEFASND